MRIQRNFTFCYVCVNRWRGSFDFSKNAGKTLGASLASTCLTIHIFAIVSFVANLQNSSTSFRGYKKNRYLFSFTLLKETDGRG